jgi:hypothetical protein
VTRKMFTKVSSGIKERKKEKKEKKERKKERKKEKKERKKERRKGKKERKKDATEVLHTWSGAASPRMSLSCKYEMMRRKHAGSSSYCADGKNKEEVLSNSCNEGVTVDISPCKYRTKQICPSSMSSLACSDHRPENLDAKALLGA